LSVVDNIWTGPAGRINLEVEVVGLDDKDQIAWSTRDHYDNIESWKKEDIAMKLTAPAVEQLLGLNEKNDRGKFILNWVVECLTDKELAKWNGNIEVRVTDLPDGKKPRLWKLQQFLQTSNGQTAEAAEPARCQNG
jgi:hypothetical protein